METATIIGTRELEPIQSVKSESGQLEVNVIFTDPVATAVALETATTLALDLNACVRLRAAIVVPFRLPLDCPQVSISFIEGVLSDLVRNLRANNIDLTVHLYLSRDRTQTFLEILRPPSLVVISGRKRLWASGESRLAKRLQSEGHRVLFLPFKGEE